jgi:HEAT repeat protein
MRAARIDALMNSLGPLQKARAGPEVVAQVVPQLMNLCLGGEIEKDDPGRKLFQPSVPLAEEVLLALGRTHDPMAVELVLAAIQGEARELRGHACLALGMLGQASVAERLLPALLDEDPFVRFCASESLRHLVQKEAPIDWTSASFEQRVAAAEELKQWFQQQPR